MQSATNFLATSCYVARSQKKKRKPVENIFEHGYRNNKFQATREPGSGGQKYFLAPLNSHIFSPYFRALKRIVTIFFHTAMLYFMDSTVDTPVRPSRVFRDNGIKCSRFMRGWGAK